MASASVGAAAAAAQPVINSDDPAWAHCFCPNITKKHSLICNYCGKKVNAGITRMKYHLAQMSGFNVRKCSKVPSPVKQEMEALINKKDGDKEEKKKEKERDREGIDIDHSDGEKSSDEDSDTGTSLSAKVQAKLTTQKREERRDRVCEYICQFFYEASIPHNTVTLPNFSHMVEAIGQFGRALRVTSPFEMSGPFLKKRKQKVLDGFKNHEEYWQLTGCTVMTDAWTDKKGRGVMNLVVHSAHGVCFLDSVDCSGVRKDGKYIFELVDKCIQDIGEENVVQVVTDNASVNVLASCLLAAKRPSIFWNGCAAHCLDLMLEHIGKLGPVEQTIANGRQLTAFLYAHTRVLDLMRKYLGKDLVRAGVTRFATAYLNLKSLQDNKKELIRLFRSDELNNWDYLKKAKGKKAIKVVRSETFWKNVDNAVNYFEPLANVLRRMDSDVPSMDFFHGCMIEAKKEISLRFENDESKFKNVWDIIDKSKMVAKLWHMCTKSEVIGNEDSKFDMQLLRLLKRKRESKSRDPIEKEIDDVLAGDGNEFITGIVPNEDREETEVNGTRASQQHESSMSQPQDEARPSQTHEALRSQPPAKRKRPMPSKKRKLRSIRSLMRNVEQPDASASASSSESEGDQDGDISMHSGDSAGSEDD
ncbi:hypothetical protein U9M48_004061 [Paspalum notatum var. saurae]|uniref:BED-type domain-containing protein n=1 Tax=Paspalum notatum var. saurae TaxID=547442 RepID=A0AAQ3PUT8_PASNO